MDQSQHQQVIKKGKNKDQGCVLPLLKEYGGTNSGDSNVAILESSTGI